MYNLNSSIFRIVFCGLFILISACTNVNSPVHTVSSDLNSKNANTEEYSDDGADILKFIKVWLQVKF